MEAGVAPCRLRGATREIFAQAEAALERDSQTRVGAGIRASRTIRVLGEQYLADSIQRGKRPRTTEQRISRLNAHMLTMQSRRPPCPISDPAPASSARIGYR